MADLDKELRSDHISLPDTNTDVLRLDLLHPVISGNKWFKLKEYLADAATTGKNTILTFGGAYSNHIIATATAAKLSGFKSIGIIRGEQNEVMTGTLLEAAQNNMQLYFTSREDYRRKIIPISVFKENDEKNIYIINEGGYGIKGMKGAATILENIDLCHYTHIIAAVGTGTTLAGLISAAQQHQSLIGISVMRNNFSLEEEINALLPEEKKDRFTLVHEYSFGGYAKHNETLIRFMNEWFRATSIPSDFVYTGKLFYAVKDLVEKKFFPGGSKLLVIHSGGLQGNRSLKKGTLIF